MLGPPRIVQNNHAILRPKYSFALFKSIYDCKYILVGPSASNTFHKPQMMRYFMNMKCRRMRKSREKISEEFTHDVNKFIDKENDWTKHDARFFNPEGESYQGTDSIFSEEVEPVYPNLIDLSNEFTTTEVFKTLEEADTWIRSKGKGLGVTIVRTKSDFAKGRSAYVNFGCVRSGKRRDHQKGGVYIKKVNGEGRSAPRKSKTTKIDCPFLVKCTQDRKNETWRFKVESGEHNHKLASHCIGHPYAGRLSQEEMEVVRELSKSSVKPRNILKLLREQNSKSCTTPKIIYNIRAKMKKNEMGGRSIVQEVFNLADSNNSFIRHTRSGDIIENVFWAHSNCLALTNSFPHVFMIDCTYKTNKYKMPLLHVVGVTSTNKSFSVAFALLSSEREQTYTWAMEMIREALEKCKVYPKCIVTDKEKALINSIAKVFPKTKRLLCRWPILMNVQGAIRTSVDSKHWDFLTTKWNEIVYSRSEEELTRKLAEVNIEGNEVILKYMKGWVDEFKAMFISAWTDEYFHLGNTSTSRTEGMHGVLKSWLGTSNCDMVTHWKAVVDMCEEQVFNIQATFQVSLMTVPRHLVDAHWCRYLRGHVSINVQCRLFVILGRKFRKVKKLINGRSVQGTS